MNVAMVYNGNSPLMSTLLNMQINGCTSHLSELFYQVVALLLM